MIRARPDDAAEACPEYPAGVESLLDVLAYQHAHMPGRVACHRIARTRRDLTAEPMTVDDLVGRARRAAAALAGAGVRSGDRVVLSLADPHDFLTAFVGTLMAGAVAVPLPTVGEAGVPRAFAARVRAVATDCAPSTAIVEGRDAFVRTVPTRMTLLEPLDLGAGPATALAAAPSGGTAAFIQYTSGSTGTPKGVVVTHANVLANCRAIRDATGYTRADRMVSWLPLHHDMGLVGGLLTSLYCAAETWLMPPLAFVARPVTWLEAIGRFAATLTVAPTFAYGLCARKIPDRQLGGVDLSSLRLAYVGAEPIDRGTVEAFAARFAPRGLAPTAIYPVYGLAEATLAVTFPSPGTPLRVDTVDRRRLADDGVAAPAPAGPASVSLVCVGAALPRHTVTIVEAETGTALPERRVGEIVVRGDSVSPRYFADSGAASRAALRTGDLGYVADGALYVVDRIKDLVIINGRNYAPSDIERAAATVDGVRQGRVVAFSLPSAGGSEELHVVAEMRPTTWRAPAAVAAELRRRIVAEIGLSVASLVLVAAGSLERTSSGKIKRRACVDAYRAGTLRVARTRADALGWRLQRSWRALRGRGGELVRAVRAVL